MESLMGCDFSKFYQKQNFRSQKRDRNSINKLLVTHRPSKNNGLKYKNSEPGLLFDFLYRTVRQQKLNSFSNIFRSNSIKKIIGKWQSRY